ncbi:acyl-CoA dehydrogenase family protein [Streptomyces sp. NPDC097619]|uniref:acyl-CoA dehydrogenase family protein n=1 Tax=Streptomyces sp. NPDC097619 TaxID=3157228 RepID=UPI00332B7722
MDAAFTAEQDEIRRTLRELLAKHCGPDQVKAAVRTPAGYDTALWRRLARGMGLPGLALPERYGGVGCSFAELVPACEETGAALLPSPLLATAVLVAPLVQALGTERQRSALLPPLAAGGLTAALAVPGPALATALALTCGNRPGDWAGDGRAGGIQARRAPVPATVPEPALNPTPSPAPTDPAPPPAAGPSVDPGGSSPAGEAGWRLYGEAAQVLDGHSAGLLLVPARTGGYARGRVLLFLVRADAPGLRRIRQTALDETRPQARLELRDVPAELLGADEEADVCAALADVGAGAAAVLAAEAAGAAGRALARTVEYVCGREQFGRPIGSFQAVKHRLADLYVQVQAARSAAYYAARDREQGALALAQGLEALRLAASEAVQLHGGIGFTWEHEAHLYFKRAAADGLLFGPVEGLRGFAAERAGLFGAEPSPGSSPRIPVPARPAPGSPVPAAPRAPEPSPAVPAVG